MLFPTTLVGSYPQPEWLIDRKKLAGRFPPRVRAKELWRIPPEFLEEAWNDATLLAIRAQERAGIDIISDGEMRRESYSNRFATALDGVDLDNPGEALDRSGTLAIAGIHLSDIPALDYQRHLFHERQVRSVTANTRSDGEEFLSVAADIGITVQTQPYAFVDADQALRDLAHDRFTGAAVLHIDKEQR